VEKSKFEKELGNVPPVPANLFDQVIEGSTANVWYFPTKIVAALFILGVTTVLYLQQESKNGSEATAMIQAEYVSYIYETYSDTYDLLSDL
jgi:hypothetical protein